MWNKRYAASRTAEALPCDTLGSATAPLWDSFSHLYKTEKCKHRKTPYWLADLPLGFLHTGLPNPWDLVRSQQELYRQSLLHCWGPAASLCPESHALPQPQRPWPGCTEQKGQLRAPSPISLKAWSPQLFEGIYISGCRAVSIKASSDLVCSGTGNTTAVSPRYSAHISPDVYTALLLLLPRLAWSFKTNSCSSTYYYSSSAL